MKEFHLREMLTSDIQHLPSIVNYYIHNTTFHFSTQEKTAGDFIHLVNSNDQLPKLVLLKDNKPVGFGWAYPFRPEEPFSGTVKFTYWISPGYTGKGLGKYVYDALEEKCLSVGIKSILVNISSENTGSLKFHLKQGFVQCGNFEGILNKQGKAIDIIWMQKRLS